MVKRKLIAGIACVTMILPMTVGCSGDDGKVKLGDVEGIVYENGILSYDEVSGAAGYDVVFSHLGEVVYEDKIEDTAIDIESLGLEGKIKLEISAYAGSSVGAKTTYEFTVLSTFGNIVFEAEDNLYNFGTGKKQSNFRNNTMAHKGAYVGGIDDAGQGVFINYLCPVAGTYDFTVYYCMNPESGFNVAYNDVWVNGEKQARFTFDEVTGWGGDRFDAANTTERITLEKGWNTISVMKNGDASDNWGGFAELDYFILSGDGSTYDVDELASYGTRPAAYRLEAEMGSPRRVGTSGMSECKNPCIKEYADKKFSNGFIMGNIESNYDGVEWHFNSPVKAKYSIKLAYASGEFDGSKLAKPTVIVTQEEVLLYKNADFKEMEQHTFAALPYTDWGNVTVTDESVEITLEAGKNFIYCLLLDSADSGFFQIDYAELTYIGLA